LACTWWNPDPLATKTVYPGNTISSTYPYTCNYAGFDDMTGATGDLLIMDYAAIGSI
jgi:hypothetical protein